MSILIGWYRINQLFGQLFPCRHGLQGPMIGVACIQFPRLCLKQEKICQNVFFPTKTNNIGGSVFFWKRLVKSFQRNWMLLCLHIFTGWFWKKDTNHVLLHAISSWLKFSTRPAPSLTRSCWRELPAGWAGGTAETSKQFEDFDLDDGWRWMMMEEDGTWLMDPG